MNIIKFTRNRILFEICYWSILIIFSLYLGLILGKIFAKELFDQLLLTINDLYQHIIDCYM